MFAVIETGGKQYHVQEGDILFVEKLNENVGDTLTFEKVLMVNDQVGEPYLKAAKVTAEIKSHGKGKKIVIFKYKAKKDYRKKQGHRQPFTKIEIKSIAI
jgi:large subunit ribosomal protein L21